MHFEPGYLPIVLTISSHSQLALALGRVVTHSTLKLVQQINPDEDSLMIHVIPEPMTPGMRG